MNETEIFEQVRNIISLELQVEPESIQFESNANTISGWDSISNIRIIDSLESAFSIEFSIEAIYEANSISDLINYILLFKK
jgi:acyl carrier protein